MEAKTRAFVYYHQGMTDLVVCMGLIDYYASLYDEVLVFLRSDAEEMMNFYLRGKPNVKPIYFYGDDGRYYGAIEKSSEVKDFYYVSTGVGEGSLLLHPDYVMCTHGEHDKWREDDLGFRWYHYFINNKKLPGKFTFPHFTQAFYEYYNIEYAVKVTDFNIVRDRELEDASYEKFIQEHGKNYVLYHDDQNREEVEGIPSRSTQINLDKKDGISYVNLGRATNVFFDYLKILENAQEIHLIDSVWACLLYQLDCRYNMFENDKGSMYNKKTINVYCQRGHNYIFSNPIDLPNWNLI